MKKLGLFVSMLLCALVMFSCANPANGKDADSKIGVPDGLYKAVKMVNPLDTIEGEQLEAISGTMALFYINYTDGKCDCVGKETDGSYKIYPDGSGTLKADNTFEIKDPGDKVTRKGTWKYENELLEITTTQGEVSMVITYKKFANAIQK